MTCGQPQGGCLSSVLCDIYYSDLDRTELGEFQNGEDLLIRAVDDYLFVTTDLGRAIRYVIFSCLFFVSQVTCQLLHYHLY
jgi:telomerase reverse transcriptase